MSYLNGKSFNPAMNRRSLIAGVAGLGSAAILAGCTNDGDAKAAGSGAAGAAGTFKLGAVGPLTGANASYGVSVCNGTELGAKDFSDDTFKFEVNKQDDVADGEKAVNAFNTLLDWGMQALVGPTTTGAAVTVAPEANDVPVFMITPSASSTKVTEGFDCVFQACFTDPNQGSNAAKFVAEKLADKKIAILYRDDDDYSTGIRNGFKEQAEASKLQIVDEKTFQEGSQSSFKDQLTSFQAAGADLVFAPIYYTPASALLANAKDMGYTFTLMGCDGMDGLLGVENFDTALAEGVYLMTPFSADDEKNADFVKAYQDAYGETPDQFAADAYDCVHAIHEALVSADADPTAAAEDLAPVLAEAIQKISIEGLTGKLSWNDKGQVEKEPTAYVIKDGKYVQA